MITTSAVPDMTLTPDWRLVFHDNFDQSNLDMNKWWTRYVYNDGYLDYLNDEWERYRESGNHVMTGSTLRLTALPFDDSQGFYPSGMIRSKDTYPIYNGDEWYFESRIKVAGFKGAWNAFWIAGSERVAGDDQSIPWPPEIDQMEVVNNGQDDTCSMLHTSGQVNDWNNNPQNYGGLWAADNFGWQWMCLYTTDLSQEFHRYGLYYKAGEFVTYLDRKPILQCSYNWVADDRQPMPGCYVLLNLAVGGQWAGRYGVDDSALPAFMEVDYVHVYTRVPQSTIGHNLLPT